MQRDSRYSRLSVDGDIAQRSVRPRSTSVEPPSHAAIPLASTPADDHQPVALLVPCGLSSALQHRRAQHRQGRRDVPRLRRCHLDVTTSCRPSRLSISPGRSRTCRDARRFRSNSRGTRCPTTVGRPEHAGRLRPEHLLTAAHLPRLVEVLTTRNPMPSPVPVVYPLAQETCTSARGCAGLGGGDRA
jgi:hypothetical protein